jgi:DNA-binding response OmpR family regulator
VLDPARHKVSQDDRDIELTKKEYALLEYFMRHQDQVISRDELLGQLWEFDTATFSNVIDIHIKNLRKKLHDKDQTFLETVRGVGYRLKG